MAEAGRNGKIKGTVGRHDRVNAVRPPRPGLRARLDRAARLSKFARRLVATPRSSSGAGGRPGRANWPGCRIDRRRRRRVVIPDEY
jgi:hypothetical protein